MEHQPAAGSRTPLILLGSIVLLVVVAIVVVLTRGPATPADPRSPEGVVQSYVTVLLAGNQNSAADLLTSDAKRECHAGASLDQGLDDGNLRVWLVATTISGTTATVKVTLSETIANGPFGLGQSKYEDSFTLLKTGDTWLISVAPWPLLACSESAVNTP